MIEILRLCNPEHKDMICVAYRLQALLIFLDFLKFFVKIENMAMCILSPRIETNLNMYPCILNPSQ